MEAARHTRRRVDVRERRAREARFLAGALVVLALGAWAVLRAVAEPFAEVETAIEQGRIVDLSSAREDGTAAAARLADRLTGFTDTAERRWVAERILERAAASELPNVGALAALRVSAAQLGETSAPVLRARLHAAAEAGSGEGDGAEVTAPLLAAGELRELKPSLIVRSPDGFRSAARGWLLALAAGFAAVHLLWRMRGFGGDQLVLPGLALLCGLGALAMVGVRDPLRDLLLLGPFVQGVLGGLVLLALVSTVDLGRLPLRRVGFTALLAAVALSSALILLGTGPGTSDAKVNLFGAQPVPVIKLLLVLFFASYFADRWEFLREVKEKRPQFERLRRFVDVPKLEYLLPPLVAMALMLGFFFLQRDLGPALVLGVVFLAMYATARGRVGLALGGLALLVAGFWIGYQLGIPRTVTGRIDMWLSPWDNRFAGGDHLAHALWALSSGGLFGAGPGRGLPEAVPEVHTDLVLIALGEQLGFLGLLAVAGLYAVLLHRFLRAARRAANVYELFLGFGIALLFAFQVVLIAGGVTGLLPLSGVVTPFLSYGKSAMVINLLLAGAVLAISSRPAAANPAVANPAAAPVGPGSGSAPAVARFRPAIAVASGVLVALLLALIGKIAVVQVLRADETMVHGTLTVHADGERRLRYNPRLLRAAAMVPRGDVVDRNGIPLATSDPAALEPYREVLLEMGIDVGDLALRQRDPARAQDRIYPLGGRTDHLLGDLNSRRGFAASNTSFIERDEGRTLQGFDDVAADPALATGARDLSELVPLVRGRGRATRRLLERDRTVRMTIDARLQQRAAAHLSDRLREAGAERAAVVVLDAASGDLLASLSYPWRGVSEAPAAEGGEPWALDRARYGLYPPGSTFKLVTSMAALRKDSELAEETYRCSRLDGGRVGQSVRGWGRPVRDDPTHTEPHGELSLERGIVVSCNAYFAQLAVYGVGAERLLETAALLGIDTAKPNTVEALADSLAQAAYGQGQVVATPFEMARVAATVANGGVMPRGRWVAADDVIADDVIADDVIAGDDGEPPVRLLSEGQAELLARAMRQVATVGSGAAVLRDATPAIAGKTGTAEVAGQPSHSWFVGFAPYGSSGRKIAFAVIVENGGYGGRTAARIARDVVREASALGLLQ
ncbi:MAG TPA: FtsW/RodA/SpoVE family cell cycle protein [Thermoanaerobaculia bacterium]|nr:FtsW/RodA/SpoVE family cell cycle protein [Thermoanaerobaculia bacterium]